MEVYLRCAALAVVGTLGALLLRRSDSELSVALSILAAVMTLLSCRILIEPMRDLFREFHQILGTSSTFVRPVLKCLMIALLARLCSALCKDTSQTVLAAAVEIAGTFSAAAVCVPYIVDMLHLIHRFL